MNYNYDNYGGDGAGGAPEPVMRGEPGAPSAGQYGAPGGAPQSPQAPQTPEDAAPRVSSEQAEAETPSARAPSVPEDARPYVGGERTRVPESAPTASVPGEAPPEHPAGDGRQQRAWSEADYRALPERETNAYTPGLPDPAQYSQYRHTPPSVEQRDAKTRGRRRGGFLRAACLAVVCAALSAASTFGVIEYRSGRDGGQPTNTVVLGNPPGQTTPNPSEGGTQAVVTPGAVSPNTIYEMARKQVISVTTEASGYSGENAVVSSGSGFIISNDGYILTNHHVIESAAARGFALKVYLEDGTAYDAQIVGYEQENDVAVLKIAAEGLDAVTTGDSDTAKVGDSIYAVGDPLGQLKYTMTDGIISALDRVVAVDRQTSISMFQISAAVNSGNSGGPVYDTKGEVIGIVSAKYSSDGVEGLGFAIPINDAVEIAEQLITTGYVLDKAYLGVGVRTMDASTAEFYNLAEGAYVINVEPGSCAEAAGVKPGDIITKLGDFAVTSADTLKLAKRKYDPGDTVDIVVHRAGETLTLQITLDRDAAAEAQPVPAQPS